MATDTERRLEDLIELIKIWLRFYRILMEVFATEDSLPPEKERDFQKIKTTVAEKHDSFMRVIDRDEHIGQNILNLVKRVISLEEFRRLSTLEINKVLLEWHEANILLQETLGSLEYKTSAMGKHNAKDLVRSTRPSILHRIRDLTAKRGFKPALILLVIGVVSWVGHENWDEISSHPIYVKYVQKIVDEFMTIFK